MIHSSQIFYNIVTSLSPFSIDGIDYVALSNFRIRWQADQVDPRYIPTPTANDPVFEVIIMDDSVLEPREYFEIELMLNPTGNGRNGLFYPSAVGRVTIIDDDTCKLLLVYNNSIDEIMIEITMHI